MSDRERWIVYPLLLMALGLALQPKFVPVMQLRDVKCDKLTCNEIVASRTISVVDPNGVPLAELRATPAGGQLDVVNNLHARRGPRRDADIRMYASDGLGTFIHLGTAKLRTVGESKPEETKDGQKNTPVTKQPEEDKSEKEPPEKQ